MPAIICYCNDAAYGCIIASQVIYPGTYETGLPMKIAKPFAWLCSLLAVGLTAGAYAQPNLLEPDVAFKVNIVQRDEQTLTAQFTIAKNYYLYRDRMRFNIKDSPGFSIKSVRFPEGILKQDPNFGKTVVYKNVALVDIVFQRPAGSQKVTVVADYQGCEEKTGVCYPPMQKAQTLTLKN
jgi:thiol:disulfide interchange protein